VAPARALGGAVLGPAVSALLVGPSLAAFDPALEASANDTTAVPPAHHWLRSWSETPVPVSSPTLAALAFPAVPADGPESPRPIPSRPAEASSGEPNAGPPWEAANPTALVSPSPGFHDRGRSPSLVALGGASPFFQAVVNPIAADRAVSLQPVAGAAEADPTLAPPGPRYFLASPAAAPWK